MVGFLFKFWKLKSPDLEVSGIRISGIKITTIKDININKDSLQCPGWELSLRDGVVQISDWEVWVIPEKRTQIRSQQVCSNSIFVIAKFLEAETCSKKLKGVNFEKRGEEAVDKWNYHMHAKFQSSHLFIAIQRQFLKLIHFWLIRHLYMSRKVGLRAWGFEVWH